MHAWNFEVIFTNIMYKTSFNQNYDTAIIQDKEKYRENIPNMINLRLFVVDLFYFKFPFSAQIKSSEFFQHLDHSF